MKKLRYLLSLCALLTIGCIVSYGQSIPPTNSIAVCSGCSPVGWTHVTLTNDVSDKNHNSGIVSQPWFYPMVNPPNGHATFISGVLVRNPTFLEIEESSANITGLTIGITYFFTFYFHGNTAQPSIAQIPGSVFTVFIGGVPYSYPLETNWQTKTVSFVATAPTMLVKISGQPAFVNSTHAVYLFSAGAITQACNAGSSTPTLSSTMQNSCPANLSSITASNKPAGTTITWHTGTPATTANKIANPSSMGAGVYYAAFFDSAGNCYSPTSTFTVSCCSIDLTEKTASNQPVGTTLTFHTGSPATTANKIANPTDVGPGSYYAAFYDTVSNCYSPTYLFMVGCCEIDLTQITASNQPAGTTITFHSGTPATTANKIANPTNVFPGTYYMAFFDAAGNCYSPTLLLTEDCPTCVDGSMVLLKSNVQGCPNNVLVDLKIKNSGGGVIAAGTKITFYDKDPTVAGATKISTFTTPTDVADGASKKFLNVDLGICSPTTATLYAVLGADGTETLPINLSALVTKGFEDCAAIDNLGQLKINISCGKYVSVVKN